MTGFVLSGLPRSALYDRLAVQLAQYEQQENYARSFAYASGPAYGLLLDDADAVLLKRGNAGITAAVVAVTPTDTAPMKGEVGRCN